MIRTFKIYSLSSFQIYNTVSWTIVTMLYISFLGLIYLIIGNLYLLTTFIHFAHPLLWPLATTSLFSVFVNLVWFCLVIVLILDSTYKRDHVVFIFVWLISLRLRSIYVVTSGKIPFFFWLNNTPVCIYTTFFFTHLSTDGYLDCFHVLPIVNSATVNMGVHIIFQVSIFTFFG